VGVFWSGNESTTWTGQRLNLAFALARVLAVALARGPAGRPRLTPGETPLNLVATLRLALLDLAAPEVPGLVRLARRLATTLGR
jgi:hypothetical protein